MKCPIPKCKKTGHDLQVKRTLANGTEVKRERYCPKCKNTFFTIECFQAQIAELYSKYEHRNQLLEDDRDSLQQQIDIFKEGLKIFKSLLTL